MRIVKVNKSRCRPGSLALAGGLEAVGFRQKVNKNSKKPFWCYMAITYMKVFDGRGKTNFWV